MVEASSQRMQASKFDTILIANRGEIACRIARTARAMGYRTVAVYSDADAAARHVELCDLSVRIGPAEASASYLDGASIIDAARRIGASHTAIHPGYGFLSENAAFAAAVVNAGFGFIGPPAEAIAAMGNKAAAKRRMIKAGVPTVPGFQGADATDSALADEAKRIGLPVMVKAAAGGGGRGMRLVTRMDDLTSAIASARSEAKNAFGSGELILEKAVMNARHIEIQVFADLHGNVVHLGERDCSVQRRHQKVIEEAPSPAVDAELRARMGAVAVQVAEAIDYVGAGTVEFLLGDDGQFYFLEMNTRLQVEHPVTEAITGLDLVEWQIRVARGERLPRLQRDIGHSGHAIEARLYAEDPEGGFLPQSGRLHAWRAPRASGVRVDHGLLPRDAISPHYDPMIAKVIAHGADREEARRRLIEALGDTVCLGVADNRRFLIKMLQHEAFVDGAATTGFIGSYFAAGSEAMARPAPSTVVRAIAATLLIAASGEVPQGQLAGWSSTGDGVVPVDLSLNDGMPVRLHVRIEGSRRFRVRDGDASTGVELDDAAHGEPVRVVRVDGVSRRIAAMADAHVLHLSIGEETFVFRDRLREPAGPAAGAAASQLRAPMNGRIVRVQAKAGDAVSAGQCVVVLEAMKMQHEIAAPRAGVLSAVHATEGQQVATRALLAEMADA
jgi:geranyl-CoA carboxylase alpha subunit